MVLVPSQSTLRPRRDADIRAQLRAWEAQLAVCGCDKNGRATMCVAREEVSQAREEGLRRSGTGKTRAG